MIILLIVITIYCFLVVWVVLISVVNDRKPENVFKSDTIRANSVRKDGCKNVEMITEECELNYLLSNQ